MKRGWSVVLRGKRMKRGLSDNQTASVAESDNQTASVAEWLREGTP